MSRIRRVKLLDSTMLLATALLDGVNPTPSRVDQLLSELQVRRIRMTEANMPLDDQDRELGRRPLRAREHAEILQGVTEPRLRDPEAVELAVAEVEESQRTRASTARERLQEKIAENRSLGLDPKAPALEEEPPVETPTSEPRATSPETPPIAEQALVASAPAPEPTSDAAEIEEAKRAGLGRVYRVAESLERRALQQMPTLRAAGRTIKSLEDAAEVLIAELDPGDQDALRQVMAEHSLANWVVVLGAVKRMADLQELNAGEFSEAWLNRQQTGGTPASAKTEICQMCQGSIPPDPVRKNRIACCNKHGSGFVEHTVGCPLAHLQMVKGKWQAVPATA